MNGSFPVCEKFYVTMVVSLWRFSDQNLFYANGSTSVFLVYEFQDGQEMVFLLGK